jgi:predicted helicase
MNIEQYLETLNKRYITGIASEHTYRSDLELLVRGLVNNIEVTNEPSQVTDCGNPDYVITKSGIPIGYIEAKDIGKDLNSKVYVEQFTRYRNALDNLIITDYVWFQFFENNKPIAEIRIADIQNGRVVPNPEEFDKFKDLIVNFTSRVTQAIKSPAKLAELMAGKARLLQKILQDSLDSDIEKEKDTELTQQLSTFRAMLIHDLGPKEFSDLYAQTLAYGMFASRYHDETLDSFDRDEAARLIPKSNPLLRNLFQSIAGYNIDERIRPTVDNLAEVFRHADVKSILSGYGKSTQQTDPIVHFYETFLSKYDAKLRKARGVWYTPAPVVRFIVRAVDEILKTKFNLKDGLADTSKTKVEVEVQGTAVTKGRYKGNAIREKKEVHKVQILDPATGTGTFLAEVIQHLHDTRFKGMQGAWPSYVENNLIPRLNGFELLMASYAMAHLKLDMLLGETGCNTERENRFRIFLTNSLEEYHPDTNTLFSSWLSSEAQEANAIKKDTPVMVIMGNPPYSGSSSNIGDWIMSLMDDYKKEPGGKEKLKERKTGTINDDYVKFMRFSQYLIEKNGEGIMAFINPHGFLDSSTSRGMRWSLLKAYDEIYILDLHGNTKKKETCPDGSKDENIFDIMQGVSINFFIKTGKKKKGTLAQVHHFDLHGKRKDKYSFLENTQFTDVPYQSLPNVEPMYFMVPKDFKGKKEYDAGFSIDTLFNIKSNGVTTSRDGLAIDFNKKSIEEKIKKFFEFSPESVKTNLKVKNTNHWNIEDAQSGNEFNSNFIKSIDYRLFDTRQIYFDDRLIHRRRLDVMKHFISRDNIGLISLKSARKNFSNKFGITKEIVDKSIVSTLDNGYVFPLYLYPDDDTERIPNLNTDEIKIFTKKLNLPFVVEKQSDEQNFSPIDILDYIYAILHSPNYRDKYKEFLKIDFPRIPYPNIETFWQLVTIGKKIRELHLMESNLLDELITTYPQAGDNIITRKLIKTSIGYEATDNKQGRVWINDEQYFDNVPLIAWEFYIGGYQPAQKWLKDRKGRELSFEDILHYQKIVKALSETHRLMKEVDTIIKF